MQQLLARGVRTAPEGAQLAAHLNEGVQRRVVRHDLRELLALRRAQLGLVAVEPLAGRLQRAVLDSARILQLGQLLAIGRLDGLGIASHHVVAVGDDGFQRVLVDRLHVAKAGLGRHLLDLRQTDDFERADVAPADVELIPLDRELGRRGVRVVVVVQLFAADDDAPRRHVRRSVFAVEVAVAPEVAQTVDDAGSVNRNPQHLHGPHRQAQRTEHQHVEDQHQTDALPRELRIHVLLDPIVRRTVAELLDRFLVLGLSAIQLRAFHQHLADASGLRAVRILFGFALGVVLAVNGGPFLRDHAGGQPQPETEEVSGDGMHVQRPVRLAAVQKNRDAGDGDVRHHQRENQDLPPGPIQGAVGKESQKGVDQSVLRGQLG
ncbi:hypothetical protein COLO4_00898 [Corchorus olitorius]|uniref:Uncharacterized protein n=1 Tax=Corchorus olitorius TaxID=93759 RepID=A0A1R3L377_9ROSI|nr:hypothetical protein COLO4_00898 [Corchorus olitorius]